MACVCTNTDPRIPEGVLWPMDVDGDIARAWVERCDTCKRFANDDDAAGALAESLGAPLAYDHAIRSWGEPVLTPYVEDSLLGACEASAPSEGKGPSRHDIQGGER